MSAIEAIPVRSVVTRRVELLGDFESLVKSALVGSELFSRKIRLGGFAVGVWHAQWLGEQGEQIGLEEKGIQINGTSIPHRHVSLDIVSRGVGVENVHTLYTFNPRDVDSVTFCREELKSESAQDRTSGINTTVSGLTVPTTKDLNRLYDELDRGASGLYRVGCAIEPHQA